jgi:C4-dicarboxylate transporter, DctM subunit
MLIALVLMVLLLTGVPIYVALGLTSLIFFYTSGISMDILVRTLYSGVDQYALISVTGFLLVGSLFDKAGITDSLVRMVRRFMSSFKSGLAVVTIASCAIFAAVNGSGPATVATIGGIMIPAMIRSRYRPKFAGAVAASGGALGILIPPSNPFLMYGIIANQSIAALFAAGVIPGLLMAVALSFTSAIAVRYLPDFATVGGAEEQQTQAPLGWREALATLWDAKWAISAVFLLMGGIYLGFFTPIEAAEVTIAYAIFIGMVVTRTMTWRDLYKALADTLKLSGTLIILVAAGFVFARLLTIEGAPQAMGGLIGGLSNNPQVILLIIAAFLIFVGMWAETFSQIVVLVPIFLPVIMRLGIDPIQFGVVFVVCCEIGFLTPPFGANLFVAMKISGNSLEELSWSVLPFVLTYILVLILLIFVPDISLFLPRLLFGK